MENVKQHFEAEAKEFDVTIRRLIPYYEQMIDALVTALPFSQTQTFRVVDLGCGTGTVARQVKDMYPKAQITCVDIAPKMLQIAELKLGTSGMCYQLANFEDYEFSATFDVAISSLALHHLVTDEDKIRFYKKIYDSLNPSGIFYNADVILGSSLHLQEQYMSKWKKYMLLNVSAEEIEQKWIPQHYDEDHPAKLMSQLDWLEKMGFTEVDIVWKYYNFAVFGGCKPTSS